MQFRNQGKPLAPAYFRNMPGLLLAFVVLSALAHGLTFLFSTEPVLQSNEHRFGATIISTVLLPAKDKPAAIASRIALPAPQAEKQTIKNQPLTKTPEIISTEKASNISVRKNTEFKATPNKVSRKAPVKPHNEPPTKTLSKPSTTTKLYADTTTPTNDAASNQLSQQRNYLLGELQNRLNRYLTYPTRARRRGWQGEVMVTFNINERGQLKNIRLAKSSGYSLLDHSAMTAIAKLDHIELPHSLGRLQAMELQLPVRYELRES